MHTPPAQPATVVLASAHALPHPPQFNGSTAVFVQLATLPMHVVFGGRHVVPHTPAAHTCPVVQALRHDPQCPVSVRVFTSHPFAGSPSQSANPALQVVTAHAPAVHVALALANAQECPHAPQCATLDPSEVSHPLAGFASQFPHPAAQVTTVQAPAVHPATVVLASAQLWPHAPQFRGSIIGSVQNAVAPEPHTRAGAAHVVSHTPATQLCPALQAFAHAPQLALSLRVSTSQPSAAMPLQFANPTAHAPGLITHPPATHDCVTTCGNVQALLHAPQWAVLVCKFSSQPSAAVPLQSPQPVSQRLTVHAPVVHPFVAV